MAIGRALLQKLSCFFHGIIVSTEAHASGILVHVDLRQGQLHYDIDQVVGIVLVIFDPDFVPHIDQAF